MDIYWWDKPVPTRLTFNHHMARKLAPNCQKRNVFIVNRAMGKRPNEN